MVRERGAQFVQIRHLDFDPRGAAPCGFGRHKRCQNASGQADVIFLDQDGFAQVLAVIAAAPGADCVLFESAKARRGFARIQNFGARAGNSPHKLLGERGDAAQALQEIQCHAFTGQQSARRGSYACGNFSGLKFFAVAAAIFHFGCGVQQAEDLAEQIDSRENERRFGD